MAIVTGAGSSGKVIGNGKATAILFAREGAKVLCADAVEDRAGETVEAVLKEGGTASAFRADVSKAADCKAMVQAAVERYGGDPFSGIKLGRELWEGDVAFLVYFALVLYVSAITYLMIEVPGRAWFPSPRREYTRKTWLPA